MNDTDELVVVSGLQDSSERIDMPVRYGYVNEKKVKVLRDTGCTGVIIKRSLIEASQMTGRTCRCMMADGRIENVPTARVYIDTPYFSGNIVALCMDTPVYDLMVGNIPGVKNTSEVQLSSAVQTRSQRKEEQKPYSKLRVPDPISDVTHEDFLVLQKQDTTLERFRKLAEDCTVRTLKSGYANFEIHKDLLYRKFISKRSGSEKFRQLIVPYKLRQHVLKLAHESIMGGHQGIKKTTDKESTE